jgi:hypothetical protein
MLPCNGCAYRASIPGNAHIRCRFDWAKSEYAVPMVHSIYARRYFHFPFNYDPQWGPDICEARAVELDPAKVAPENPLADLLSLLG